MVDLISLEITKNEKFVLLFLIFRLNNEKELVELSANNLGFNIQG